MKCLKLIVILAASVAFLAACSSNDNSTNPQGSKNYMPNTIGTYWIQERYNLDTANNKINTEPIMDSTVVSGKETLFGKLIDSLSVFTLSGTTWQKSNNLFYYKEVPKVYMRSNILTSMIGLQNLPIQLPFTIPDTLMLVADPDGIVWNLMTITFMEIPINVPQFGTGKLGGSFTASEKRELPEFVMVGTQNMTAIKFTIDLTLKCTITLDLIPIPIPIEIKRYFHIWFVENVGLVKMYLEPTVFNLDLGTTPITFNMDGLVSTVVRYNIAP